MKRPRISEILLLVVPFLMSACVSVSDLASRDSLSSDSGDDGARVIDATPGFLNGTTQSTFRSRSDVFSISGDGRFTFHSKLIVRYFLNPDMPGGGESDAICTLDFRGSLNYYEKEQVRGSYEGHILKLTLSDAEVASAELYRSDEATPPPSTVCQLYAETLLRQKTVRMVVSRFDSDQIIGTWALDVPNERGNWIFNADSADSMGVPTSMRSYLKAGFEPEVTQAVLADLAGRYKPDTNYAGSYGAEIIGYHDYELIVDQKTRTLAVINHTCGVGYRFDVDLIKNDGDVFVLSGTRIEKYDFSPDPKKPMPVISNPNGGFLFDWQAAQSCNDFRAFLESWSNYGVAIDYAGEYLYLGDSPVQSQPLAKGRRILSLVRIGG